MPSTAASHAAHVAVGLLLDRDRVFITRRAANAHQGGKWEFPGGKLDDNEPVETALRRELHEELGIGVRATRPWMQVRHRYPDREVLLDVWRITIWDGTPHGREGQEARWASVRELPKLDFPEADLPILRRLWLPPLYLISDATRLGRDEFLRRLKRALAAGARFVQLREPGMPMSEFRTLAGEVTRLCRQHDARLLLNAEPSLVEECGADGVHLNSRRLMALRERPLPLQFFVGASCHDAAELAQAAAIGADFGVLGPVASTASHPRAVPLGWERFAELCRHAQLPVYALGGMQPSDMLVARQAGAQGLAMIRGMWNAADPERAVAACISD
jgi:8-oxo-dGTP diphosphatase